MEKQKNILISSATTPEVKPLLDYLKKEKKEKGPGQFFINNNLIEILITGVGLTRTAYTLGKTFASRYFDLALNIGIAGSFTKEHSPGNVVNVISERIADLGAEDGEGFLDIFDMGLEDKRDFPYTNGIFLNTTSTKNKYITELPIVNGISVNKVHGNSKTIDLVRKRYSPDVESMEGAAFLFACLNENFPCFEIRAISNYVEPRSKSAWEIKLAIDNLNKQIIKIINLCP